MLTLSLLLEETLLCSSFHISPYANLVTRPKLDTGSKLGSGSVLMLLETGPWRGCTSLPSSFCNISLLLSRLETGAKLPPSFSMMATASKISIYSGSSDWPDTGKGQDDWDSTFYNKTLQSTIVWIIQFFRKDICFQYWRPGYLRRNCNEKFYKIMVLWNCDQQFGGLCLENLELAGADNWFDD